MTCCENKKRIADYDDCCDFADVPEKKSCKSKEDLQLQFKLFEFKIYHLQLGRKARELHYRLLLNKQPTRHGGDTGG
jgi:hypothetical protein